MTDAIYPQVRIVPERLLNPETTERLLNLIAAVAGVRRILLNGPRLPATVPYGPAHGTENPHTLRRTIRVGGADVDLQVHVGYVLLELENRDVIPEIKAACDKVGKKGFDIGAYTAMSIDMNEKKARNAAKIVAAFIAAGSPPPLLQRHGLDAAKVANIKNALAKFDFKTAGENVDDATIDAFTIAGTPDTVKQKCEDLAKAGVTQIIFGSPLGPDMTTSIRLLGKYVV